VRRSRLDGIHDENGHLPSINEGIALTYFPPPQQPPQGPLGFDFYRPPANSLQPARRAGILMFIMAGLILFCGIGTFLNSQRADWNQVLDQVSEIYGPDFTARMKEQGQFPTPQIMQTAVQVTSILIVLLGILFIVLGVFVKRGSMMAIGTSIALASLLSLANLCPLGMAAFLTISAGPKALVGVIQMLLPFATGVALLVYLIKAANEGISLKRLQRQMQIQMWQSQQQQARQTNTGLGYGYGATGGNVPPQQAPPQPQHPFGPLPPPPDETSK
jgi:hypothetical protein